MTTYGFLGFGDVAHHFAVGVHRGEDDRFLAYDHALERPEGDRQRSRMADDEVEATDDIGGLAVCEVVLSLVTPAAALDVARAFAPHALQGQIYVDLNSTAPQVKQDIAAELEGCGVTVVDGAMTGGGVKLDGHRIPISLSGGAAQKAADELTRLGLQVQVVGDRVGQAAAMKMLRGVVIKGLEALSVEALTAARRYGVEELVLDSIRESLDRWSIRDFVAMLVTPHTHYCERRSVETRMIKETVAEVGIEPVMTPAIQRLFERSVASDLRISGQLPADLEQSIEALERELRR